MKLLILSAYYHPFIHPRAHRWTVLAEHWAKQGHEVHVLTARVGAHQTDVVLHGVQVHRTGFDSLKEWVYRMFGAKQGRGRVGGAPQKPGRWQLLFEKVYKLVWKNIFFPDDACVWYFPARKKLFQLLKEHDFDALVTVSLPFTDHLLGLAAKQRFPSLFWIADIGDPFSIQANPPNNSWLYHKKNLQLEQKVLGTADAISVTTPATKEKYAQLFGPASTKNISTIPPLFHPPALTAHPLTAHPLTLGFFGALYTPTRTPDAFLDLLTRLFKLRPDFQEKLQVHFFGEIFPEFYEKLASQSAIRLYGLRSREEAWTAMQQVDVLLNIGNCTDFQLPSKAVEYMASGKPVLNLSYVENDPFVHFFQGNILIFNILLKKGKVLELDLLRLIDWLETEKPTYNEAELKAQIKPYLVEQIADQYIRLLSPKSF